MVISINKTPRAASWQLKSNYQPVIGDSQMFVQHVFLVYIYICCNLSARAHTRTLIYKLNNK